MFDIHEWLNKESNGVLCHEYISRLVFANGGFDVRGWGVIDYRGGVQRGLDQNDALSLIEIKGFLSGLEACGIDWPSALKPYFDNYTRQVASDQSLAENQR